MRELVFRSHRWGLFQFAPTYGGGGATFTPPPQQQYIWIDHVYVSGGN